MIPRIIHRIWAGPDPIPYRLRAHADSWVEHHPGWEHRLWTLEDIDRLAMTNQDLYDRAEQEAPNDWLRWRADIARLEILHQFGGVYVDMDTACLRPFDPLLERSCWFAESPNAPGHATQAVCASEPGHPALTYLLGRLSASAAAHKTKRINHRVGSRFVDRELSVWSGTGVEVLPWRWFAGQSITERDRGLKPNLADAYCWHQYNNSDRNRAKPQIAAFRAAAKVLDQAKVEWFLTSGVLLGHIRDGAWIEWDTDVDLGIWPDAVDEVRAAFQKAGWQFRRDRDSQMWPVHRSTKIDLHTHYRDGDQVYKLHGKRETLRMNYPAHLFDDLQPTVYYLRRTLMPAPPEEYLTVQYGHDWLTPKRDWKWDTSPLNMVER